MSRGPAERALRGESLWVMAAPPSIWAAHFLLSYATASIWCAKLVGPDGSLAMVRLAIGVYTGVALAAIALLAWRGLVLHRRAGALPTHDDDNPVSRSGFIGFATLLLCGLSTVAILYSGLAAVFIGSCR